MEKKEQSSSNFVNIVKPFLFGGLAGCIATSFIYPIDTIKVRIQINNEGIK